MSPGLQASPAGRKQAVGSAKLTRAVGEAAAAAAAGNGLGLEDLPRQLNMMTREMDIYRRRQEAQKTAT